MATTSRRELSLPSELDSAQAKLVYLYLSASGDATVEELQGDLEMSKLALYSVLRTLRSRGLVQRETGRYAVR